MTDIDTETRDHQANEVREYDLPDDTTVWIGIEEAGEPSLTGIEKACKAAIKAKHLLFVVYSSSLRLVAPTCVGFGDQGQLLLRAYQLQGVTSNHGEWKLFRGDKIEGTFETRVPFDIPPGFRSGDQTFSIISAELSTEVE